MKRQISIEVLRVFAMLLIVIGHSIYNGVSNTPMDVVYGSCGGGNLLLKAILLLSHTAVNLYVMITGYFMIEKTSFRTKGFVRVWITTLFYSLLFLLLFALFSPHSLSLTSAIKSVFPVITNQYWFITTYLALLLLAPFLSKLVSVLPKRSFMALVFVMFVLSFEYPFGRIFADNGFTLFWFIFLFLFAGYIKLYSLPGIINKYRWPLVVLTFFVLLLPVIVTDLGLYNTRSLSHFLDHGYNGFVCILSFLIFVCFTQAEMNGKFWISIGKAGAYTLGIYIIHENILFKGFIWKYINSLSSSIYVYLLLTVIFFCLAMFIDWFRGAVFKWLNVDGVIEKSIQKHPNLHNIETSL